MFKYFSKGSLKVLVAGLIQKKLYHSISFCGKLSAIVLFLIVLNGCKENPTDTITNYTYYSNSDSLVNPEVRPRIVFSNPSEGQVGPFNENSLRPR